MLLYAPIHVVIYKTSMKYNVLATYTADVVYMHSWMNLATASRWAPSLTNGTVVQENTASMKYDTSTDRLEIQNLEPGDEGTSYMFVVDGNPSMQALGGCLLT